MTKRDIARERLSRFGALAFLLSRDRASTPTRVGCFAGAALLVGAIGFSRLYLGAHYLSDVLAGFTLGLAWVTLVVLQFDWIAVDGIKRIPGVWGGDDACSDHTAIGLDDERVPVRVAGQPREHGGAVAVERERDHGERADHADRDDVVDARRAHGAHGIEDATARSGDLLIRRAAESGSGDPSQALFRKTIAIELVMALAVMGLTGFLVGEARTKDSAPPPADSGVTARRTP